MCEPNKTIIAERKYLYQLRNICGIPLLTVAQRLKEKQRLSYVHMYMHTLHTYIRAAIFSTESQMQKIAKKLTEKSRRNGKFCAAILIQSKRVFRHESGT